MDPMSRLPPWLMRVFVFLRDSLFVAGAVVSLLMFGGILTVTDLAKRLTGVPHSDSMLYAGLGVLAAAVVIGAAVLVQQWQSQQLRAAFSGCVWKRATYDYYFCSDSPEHHRDEETLEIISTRDGFNVVEIRNRWTGGTELPRPQVSGDAVDILGPYRRDSWQVFYVVLDRDYDIGQTATIRFRRDLRDTGNKMDPFLCKTIVERISDLVLRVHFDPARVPDKRQILGHRLKGDPRRVVGRQHVEWDHDQRTATMSVTRPALGRSYRILWSWPLAAGGMQVVEPEGEALTSGST